QTLADALEALAAQASGDAQRRMLWVAARVAEALAGDAFAAGVHPALRLVLAGVERELRESQRMPRPGPDIPAGVQETTRQLLFHAAQDGGEHPALDALREAFDLRAPSEAELEHARGSLGGRNRALLGTVSAVVKEDLLRVKDALDLHL